MNLRIRNAVKEDIPGITACAVRFFEYAGYAEKYAAPFDQVSFEQLIRRYISDPNGVCLLTVKGDSVKGGVCGIVLPWAFNQKIKMGLELFYWMDEDVRGFTAIRMLEQYENRMKEMGARCVMVSPETNLTEKVENLYRRRGYQPWERFWIR